jgi:hypothetical protein
MNLLSVIVQSRPESRVAHSHATEALATAKEKGALIRDTRLARLSHFLTRACWGRIWWCASMMGWVILLLSG